MVGPYTLSRNRQFYVQNLLIEEALSLAVADGLDLTQFDSRHENVIDALNVLYAGQNEDNGELWPHNYHIDLQFGGIKTDLYLLTSLGRSANDLSIGTFCHENGHLLCRFPDMVRLTDSVMATTSQCRHRHVLPDGGLHAYQQVPDAEMPDAEAQWNARKGLLRMRESIAGAIQRGEPRARMAIANEIGHFAMRHAGVHNSEHDPNDRWKIFVRGQERGE